MTRPDFRLRFWGCIFVSFARTIVKTARAFDPKM
nr:MAG TPA: hypothetical protein [Caudoviricetes sp.]